MSLTPYQIQLAGKLHARRVSWTEIGKIVGAQPNIVRDALYPGYLAPQSKPPKRTAAAERGYIASAAVGHAATTVEIPQQVLTDRERRLSLAPISLTASVCGDPPPGRSALDKRRA